VVSFSTLKKEKIMSNNTALLRSDINTMQSTYETPRIWGKAVALALASFLITTSAQGATPTAGSLTQAMADEMVAGWSAGYTLLESYNTYIGGIASTAISHDDYAEVINAISANLESTLGDSFEYAVVADQPMPGTLIEYTDGGVTSTVLPSNPSWNIESINDFTLSGGTHAAIYFTYNLDLPTPLMFHGIDTFNTAMVGVGYGSSGPYDSDITTLSGEMSTLLHPNGNGYTYTYTSLTNTDVATLFNSLTHDNPSPELGTTLALLPLGGLALWRLKQKAKVAA
jgi:hypothetical protein